MVTFLHVFILLDIFSIDVPARDEPVLGAAAGSIACCGPGGENINVHLLSAVKQSGHHEQMIYLVDFLTF